MNVPAPGTDEVLTFGDSIVQEAQRSDCRSFWQDKVDGWLQLYIGKNDSSFRPYTTEAAPTVTGDTRTISGFERRIEVNRIQNAIASITIIQSGDPAEITFNAREHGEPGPVMLNESSPAAVAYAAMTAHDITQPVPEAIPTARPPMDGEQQAAPPPAAIPAWQLLEIAELGEMYKLAGQPIPAPGLTKDDVVEINDATAADAVQIAFDAMWEDADGPYYFGDNVLNKTILGWQPTLVEFDAIARRMVLTNTNVKHTFLDPLNNAPGRRQYAIYDQFVPADELRAAYRDNPEAIDKITSAESVGNIKAPGTSYPISGIYEQTFERGMVVLRTIWIANQPYPMNDEEAMREGKITTTMLPTDEQVPVVDPVTGGPLVDGSMQPVTKPKMEEAFVFPDGGGLAEPESPNWPQKRAVREIRIVYGGSAAGGGHVIYDGRCAYDRIPLCVNVNIPIPYSPYGQGEPQRLEGMQLAFNRLVSAIVTHFEYTAYPPEFVPMSVWERIPEALRDARTQPGKRIPVPDDLVERFGMDKIIQTLAVPSMGADAWKLLEFLVSAIDKESHSSDVMNGSAPAGSSGEWVQSLQAAAAQTIRAKSQRTEAWLKEIAHLFFSVIVNELSVEELHSMCGKYSPAIWRAIKARLKRLNIDISVQISSGSASSRQAETQMLLAMRGANVMVSDEAIMKRANLDQTTETQRNLKAARMAGLGQPQGEAGKEKGGEGETDKKDNKQAA